MKLYSVTKINQFWQIKPRRYADSEILRHSFFQLIYLIELDIFVEREREREID